MSVNVALMLFSSQAAQSVNKALEQFVKPEQLDGENSYKCSKYAGGCRCCGGEAGRLGLRKCSGLNSPSRLPSASISI